MHFFQRNMFQRRSGEQCDEATRRYNAYHETVCHLLNASAQAFFRHSLHDDVVQQVCWTGIRQLAIKTDLQTIVFDDVDNTNCDWRILDQVVYAHEVHPAESGTFQVLILLEDSECAITASAVRAETA